MIELVYDLLHNLFFGFENSNIQIALDPITMALILGGTKLATGVGQGFAGYKRAKKQREQGEQIAQDAMDRLENLNFEAGPQFGVTQETRDLAELQMRQSAEAIQNLRNQNLAMAQQAIASGVQDPTRSGQTIANIAPSLSQQLGQFELNAAMQSTAAKQKVADLAEQYSKANILREQGVMDMNVQVDRSLQELIRREGVQAAGLGFAAEGQAIGQMINAPSEAIDTGLSAYNIASGSGQPPLTAAQLGLKMIEKGGMLNDQIYVTGGEFNHDTNKKALVDEETGEKEAELTGDEAVLNPEQTESTMQAFKMLKEAVARMENPPEELLAALEKMSHFDEPQFQVPQMEIEIE